MRTRKTTRWAWLSALAVSLALPAVAWAAETQPTQIERWYNALWAMGLFAVLLVVLGRFAWKPVMRALNDREQVIRSMVTDAERRQQESREILDEYKARLDAVGQEAAQLIAQARAEAVEAREAALKQAQADAASATGQAQNEIEQAKRQALGEIYDAAGELATDMAGRILQRELRPEDHRRLIEQSLAELKAKRN